MKDTGRVQSIDRAVAILECFSENRCELKLSEIASRLDLNKSTVHGLLNTLKYHRFIDQDPETQRYRLGLRFLGFSDLVISSIDVGNIASPVIERVCEEIEETVHVAMLDGSDIVYIGKRECNKSIKTSTKIGARFPAYYTADGKIILCHMNREKVDELLPGKIKRLTPATITDKQELMKALAEMKEKGFAVDNEGVIQGLSCVAAPIINHTGEVKYSLSVTGPTVRMTEDKVREYAQIIKEATNEISYKIGYKG